MTDGLRKISANDVPEYIREGVATMTRTAVASDDLLDRFKSMTLLELHSFIKEFKDFFGVEDAAPATVVVQQAPVEEAEEQTEFTVTLDAIGSQKIQVIKVVREILKLGLADAKAFTESAPKVILENASKDDAEKAREQLAKVGATVSVR